MKYVIVFTVLLFASGCTKALYRWGSYDASLYRMYGTPDEFNLDHEIEILSREVDAAVEQNYAIPPGKVAHLGYLYYQRGDSALARSSFETEKRLYPESAVFMNRLIGKLK